MRVWRSVAVLAGSAAGAVGAFFVAGLLTPRPALRLVRWLFERDADRVAAALAPLVPAGVSADRGVAYRNDAQLDVFAPVDRTGPLPAVVWVHGGAWVSGGRNWVASYLQILAARGFVTVGVDYTLPPAGHYPTPVVQIADALAFLSDNADRWGIDPRRLVLAGDSAGAQLASQVAVVVTDPEIAAAVDVAAPIDPADLRAVVLACGTYRLHLADGAPWPVAWFAERVAWGYWGARNHRTDPRVQQMDVPSQVTDRFPPAFVTVGNADPLRGESERLVDRLTAVGAPVQTLFYPTDHQPPLGHEYQFDLAAADGRRCLDALTDFLRAQTAAVAAGSGWEQAVIPDPGPESV